MRGLLKFLSIMAIVAALYYARWYMSYWQVERNSAFIITDEVNRIGEHWDVAEFNKYADASLKTDAFAKSFASYQRLGSIVSPAKCSLQNFTSYKYQGTGANYIAATYECQAVYTNGPATLRLAIQRFQDNAGWKISEFHVFSPYLTSLK